MQVTPRLPLHSPFLPPPLSPYLEMRYFRLSFDSALAAILFALLEELSLPQCLELRNLLLDTVSYSDARQYKPVIDFCLNWKISEKWVLAAWNSDGYFFSLVKTAFQSILHPRDDTVDAWIAAIQVLFPVEVMWFPCENKGLKGTIPICIQYNSDTAAVFYTTRGLSSFITMPNCGHVHVKTDIYARMREAMQIPRRLDEMGGVYCSDTCKNDVSRYVFQQAQNAALLFSHADTTQIITFLHSNPIDFLQFEREMSSFPGDICRFCGNFASSSLCENECRVCASCQGIGHHTRLQMRCLACGGQVYRKYTAEVYAAASGITEIEGLMCEGCRKRKSCEEFEGVAGEIMCQNCRLGESEAKRSQTLSVSTCSICKASKETREFSISNQLNHNDSCQICDSCYNTSILTTKISDSCQVCQTQYTEHDRTLLNDKRRRLLEKNQQSESKQQEGQCVVCKAPKPSCNWTVMKMTGHMCPVCDLCFFATYSEHRLFLCPQCQQRFTQLKDALLATMEKTFRGKPEVKCQSCNATKEATKYVKKEKLRHQKCRVCDNCLSQSVDKHLKCPCCKAKYEASDRDFLNAIHKKRSK